MSKCPDNFFAEHAASLTANGYRIVPIVPGEKRPASGLGWREYQYEPGDEQQFSGCGVGIITGELVAIDIDIFAQESLGYEARQIVHGVLPDADRALERIGRAPKTLLLFRSDEPFSKKSTGKYLLSGGETAEVEILADGQQFVAFHVHPDTGRPYQWPGDSPLEVLAADLPIITEANARLIVERIRDLFIRRGFLPFARGAEIVGGGEAMEIVWDREGMVQDGRETFLRNLTWSSFLSQRDLFEDDNALVRAIAQEAWGRFATAAELTRPNATGRQWSHSDALAKARSTVRNHHERNRSSPCPRSPTYPKPQGAVGESYEAAEQGFQDFFKAVDDFHRAGSMHTAGVPLCVGGEPTNISVPRPLPPLKCLRLSTGTGKTRAALEAACNDLAANPASVGVIAAQTHRLMEELAAKAAADGRLRVRIYRGTNQPDPEQPTVTMCQRLAAASAWSEAGGKLTDLCKGCVFNGSCGTSRQRSEVADLWIVPSNMIFGGLPDPIPSDSLRWVIVDEDPIQYAIEGGGLVEGGNSDGAESLTENEALKDRFIPAPADRRKSDIGLTADYADAVRALRAAMSGESDRISCAALKAAGVSEEVASAAEQAAWRMLSLPKISGAMKDNDVIAIAEKARQTNSVARKLTVLWSAIRSALHSNTENVPGIRRNESVTAAGSVPVLDMTWRKKIGEGWILPIMLLDATAQPSLIQAVFNRHVCGFATFEVALPSLVTVRQIWDRSFASSMLAPTQRSGRNAINAARNNISKINWYIEIRAWEFRGEGLSLSDGTRPDILVTGQKRVIEQLREQGLPDNVEAVHFGNLAGRDRWSSVRCIIVIGRLMPPPEVVERIAEVLSSRDVQPADGWYDSDPEALRMRGDEVGYPVEVERHKDVIAEAIRWRICEGGLVQAIGRARGIRRDAKTPLQIDILGRSPLPGIEIDELRLWDDVSSPSIGDHLIARYGIVMPPDMRHGMAPIISKLLPDRFNDGKAVRDWLSEGGSLSLSESSYKVLIEKSDSEDRVRASFKGEEESRYSVEFVRFYEETLPLEQTSDNQPERRTGTLLTGYHWRPRQEVLANQKTMAARLTWNERAGNAAKKSLLGAYAVPTDAG